MTTALTMDTPPYGGFWIRFAAHFIDGLIISLAAILLLMATVLATGIYDVKAASGIINLMIVVMGQVYHAYFLSSETMATPGKKMCGLYVTASDGQRLGFGHALGRNICAALSYLTLYIGFIMIGFTERKQALHDKLTGTLVHRRLGSSPSRAVRLIVGTFVAVVGLGILAGIFVPAYQDYVKRTQAAPASNPR